MLPRDKAGLREMARERLVQPVHKDKFFGAHKATQFQRWLSTDSQYSIAGGPVFEPYMVVHRDVPQYSPRFIGYGASTQRRTPCRPWSPLTSHPCPTPIYRAG